MRLQVVHQFLGHLPGVGLRGEGRAVAGNRMHAHLVFDLDHDDRVLPAIHFLDMPHEGGKGLGVGIAVVVAEGAEFLDALESLELGAREPLEIPFHPVGRVTGQAVLPASEPEQHDTQVVLPRILDRGVHLLEIELAFRWFDLVQESPNRAVLYLALTRLVQIGLGYRLYFLTVPSSGSKNYAAFIAVYYYSIFIIN